MLRRRQAHAKSPVSRLVRLHWPSLGLCSRLPISHRHAHVARRVRTSELVILADVAAETAGRTHARSRGRADMDQLHRQSLPQRAAAHRPRDHDRHADADLQCQRAWRTRQDLVLVAAQRRAHRRHRGGAGQGQGGDPLQGKREQRASDAPAVAHRAADGGGAGGGDGRVQERTSERARPPSRNAVPRVRGVAAQLPPQPRYPRHFLRAERGRRAHRRRRARPHRVRHSTRTGASRTHFLGAFGHGQRLRHRADRLFGRQRGGRGGKQVPLHRDRVAVHARHGERH